METTFLQCTWFILFGVLIAGYAALDGFDLGVGSLSLFGRDQDERRLMVNAIGPVWDGNEVWLITGGGALFAAFPAVYATSFSGFYLAMMLLLLALIARAVSMEFRGKVDSDKWRRVWDGSFGAGSAVASLVFGVAVGNVMVGLPLDEAHVPQGGFLDLFGIHPLAMGLLTLAMFATHGGLYMAMKSEGKLREDMVSHSRKGAIVWGVLFVATTVTAVIMAPHLFNEPSGRGLAWACGALAFIGIVMTFTLASRDAAGKAFICSATSIVSSVATVGAALYPRFIPSSIDLENSLTVGGSSSSPHTLSTMLVIAGIGVPIFMGYTIFVYRVFKGKVHLDQSSY